MKIYIFTLLLVFYSYTSAAGRDMEANPDPLMGINQVTYRFNNTADKFVLKPIARGYAAVAPRPVRRGIGNFFGNLADVNNSINNMLQGKPRKSISDLLRIVINTTLGVAGLFDPASSMGLSKHFETFGQTLSVWGVPQGPYVVLPFFGPNTLTDALVNPLNPRLDPVRRVYPVDLRNSMFAVRAVDDRADLLVAESLVFGDRYIFLREAYLQRRHYLVFDGEVEDEFDDF